MHPCFPKPTYSKLKGIYALGTLAPDGHSLGASPGRGGDTLMGLSEA